jgi:hypothetical protein
MARHLFPSYLGQTMVLRKAAPLPSRKNGLNPYLPYQRKQKEIAARDWKRAGMSPLFSPQESDPGQIFSSRLFFPEKVMIDRETFYQRGVVPWIISIWPSS